jgi:acyl homoserine lactone synthase
LLEWDIRKAGEKIMHRVYTSNLASLVNQEAEGMFRLRYDTFHTRLGWGVPVEGGLEHDNFDLPTTSYVIGKSDDDRIDGCLRILPTSGPYMLKDVFPELLNGQVPPNATDIWELSRFTVATERVQAGTECFAPLSIHLMAEAAKFAISNSIRRYAFVTTTSIERLLKRQGLHIHRFGPPAKIGITMAVACIIEIDEITVRAVGGTSLSLGH